MLRVVDKAMPSQLPSCMIVGAQAGEALPKTASYLADITKIGKSIKCAASSDKDFLRAEVCVALSSAVNVGSLA